MNAPLLVSLIPDIIAIIRTRTRKPTPPAGSAVVGTSSWKSASHDVGAKSVRHLWSWAGGNIPSKSQWHIQWLVIRCGMKQVLGPKNPLVSKQVFGKIFFMCFYEWHPHAIRTGPWEQPFLSNHHCLRDREVQGLGSSWRATVAWRYPDPCEIFEESIRICYVTCSLSLSVSHLHVFL